MFKKYLIAICLYLVTFGVAFAQTQTNSDDSAAQPAQENPATTQDIEIQAENTVAIVNGREIKFADFYLMYLQLPAEQQKAPFADIFPFLVNNLVNKALIVEAANKEKLNEDPNYLAQRNFNNESLLSDLYLQSVYANTINDEMLQETYDEITAEYLAQKGDTEYSAQHILVESEEQALDLIAKIQAGQDFAELAGEFSMDTGTKENGGNLGFFAKGDMVPEFEAAVIDAEVGTVLAAPVKTQFGWHIIRVNETRDIQLRSFDEARDGVMQILRGRINDEITLSLRENAEISIFDVAGNKIPTGKEPEAAASDQAESATE